MSLDVKICGLKTKEAVAASVAGGAVMVGFVFFEKSPRFVTPQTVTDLAAIVPKRIVKVGLFVDDEDERIRDILAACPIDLLQLHGAESPVRCAEIRRLFGKPVMKAIRVATAADIAKARAYQPVVDRLLFDAQPPATMKDALPGGNALAFDWSLLKGSSFSKPWMLSGGINADNLMRAVRATKAKGVDVSSGVEDRPGEKSVSKIKTFLEVARSL